MNRLNRSSSTAVCVLLALLAQARAAQAKNLLSADGTSDTYELLRTAYTVEVPDCGHMVRHVTQERDPQLGRPVFVFQLHVDLDDDRCTNTDRQRAEIRARAADIVAGEDETVYYAWKFKLDAAFQGAPTFTHIFQIKSDEGAPIMTLTPRASTMAIDGRIGEHGKTELAKFLGAWVQVRLKVLFAEAGLVAMTIHRLSDGEVLLDYAGDADTWDANASGHDCKFGLYRSLNSKQLLRDEQVRFADFCASKLSAAECDDATDLPGAPGVGGGGSGGAAPSGGAPTNSAGSANGGVTSGGTAPSSTAGAGELANPGGTASSGASGTASSGASGTSSTPDTASSDPNSAGCACQAPRPGDRGNVFCLALCFCAAISLRRLRHRSTAGCRDSRP